MALLSTVETPPTLRATSDIFTIYPGRAGARTVVRRLAAQPWRPLLQAPLLSRVLKPRALEAAGRRSAPTPYA